MKEIYTAPVSESYLPSYLSGDIAGVSTPDVPLPEEGQ